MSNAVNPAELSEDIRALIWAYTRRLSGESQAVGDLTLSQQTVLARLHQAPGATSAELARAEYVSPQSMSSTVSALVDAGLVAVSPDPRDGRRRRLDLTDEGSAAIEALRAHKADWLRGRLVGQLSPAEQRQLADAVVLLRRLLDPDTTPSSKGPS
ncbi:MarR family winged helix-turn-helix transcriptional regulator [Streptomyces sp. AC512_CC834]|uniref:MarR family winged helix-turn-helix transcriptional regulator n=1 Tax=Streptomyces sp. AC512_CC834 TaxID=2823691 RepID=UPI001C26FB58|nr:MarR family transcriptional regulator [Streptomyces sp. AC512_CC834]